MDTDSGALTAPRFRVAHAAADDWPAAVQAVVGQLRERRTRPTPALNGVVALPSIPSASIGVVYVTERWRGHFEAIVERLRELSGVASWVGAVGRGVCASGVEYIGTSALAVMVGNLSPDGFQLFPSLQSLVRMCSSDDDEEESGSGSEPAGRRRTSGLMLHADGRARDIAVQIADARNLAESDAAFGGLVDAIEPADPDDPDVTQHAGEPVRAALSGIRFLEPTRVLSRVSQGNIPLGPEHRVTRADGPLLLALDDQPALEVLLTDLERYDRRTADPHDVQAGPAAPVPTTPGGPPRRSLFAAVAPHDHRSGARFGDSFLVRRLTRMDPGLKHLTLSAGLNGGGPIVFCTQTPKSARDSLVRICTELRDAAESEGRIIRAALYHASASRNRSVFGHGHQEMALIRRHLGDVPTIGLYGNRQIAGGEVHEHAAVLTIIA